MTDLPWVELGGGFGALLLVLLRALGFLTRRRGGRPSEPPREVQSTAEQISERRRERVEASDAAAMSEIRDAVDESDRQKRLDRIADL